VAYTTRLFFVSVPCRPGTSAYKVQVKTRDKACVHTLPRAPQHRTKATSLRWAPALPRVLHLRTPPPAREVSNVATRHVAPDLA
jgi:hypothetical protein